MKEKEMEGVVVAKEEAVEEGQVLPVVVVEEGVPMVAREVYKLAVSKKQQFITATCLEFNELTLVSSYSSSRLSIKSSIMGTSTR